MFTPAMLSEEKTTLDDFTPSVYDHETQTRKFIGGTPAGLPASDTQFDGERS
jgi:hypothetical protein